MALNDRKGSGRKVTNIADARKDRLEQSSIPYGSRSGDSDGPNAAALRRDAEAKPNVRQVREGRTSGRRFDSVKVEKIKRQLAIGEYQIDALKVADLFIEHERHG